MLIQFSQYEFLFCSSQPNSSQHKVSGLCCSVLSQHIPFSPHTATMRLEEFHQEFLNGFTPVVILYIDTLEQSLRQDLAFSLAQETWLPIRSETSTTGPPFTHSSPALLSLPVRSAVKLWTRP